MFEDLEIPEEVFTQRMKGNGLDCAKIVGVESMPVIGKEMAALWDRRADFKPVDRYYRLLHGYSRAISSNLTWNPFKAEQLHLQKCQVIRDFEKNFEDYYNDRRVGLKWFGSAERFEPHQLIQEPNKVTWQGLAHFLRIAAGQTSQLFDYMGIGIGTASFIPNNRNTLFNQISIISSRQFGDVNTDGNVFKMSAPFPTNVATNNVTEYAGFTKGTTPNIMLFIAIATKALAHIMNETFVQATHHIIFVSRTS